MKEATSTIGALTLPIDRLHLEVTNHCNFSCEFCPDSKLDRERAFMDFDVLTGVVDEVSEKSLAKVVWFHVMGEPTLYPRLVEAVAYVARKGLDPCMTTNGSLLTHEMIGELTGAGLKKMIISLQTPDEKTFGLRGAKVIDFKEYAERVASSARKVIKDGKLDLTVSFLASPLRKLIIPIVPDISIADTEDDLRVHLSTWAASMLKGTPYESNMADVKKKLKWIWTFKPNVIDLSPNVKLETKVLGDWGSHSIDEGVKAHIGSCPGIQENFGVLCDGSFVFCCVDYNGRTSSANFKDTTVEEYLASDAVQQVVRGFKRLRVIHPHCQRCLGDRNYLHAAVRQVFSIVYFKGFRKLFNRRAA